MIFENGYQVFSKLELFKRRSDLKSVSKFHRLANQSRKFALFIFKTIHLFQKLQVVDSVFINITQLKYRFQRTEFAAKESFKEDRNNYVIKALAVEKNYETISI